jgi:ribosome-associated translation inhibitor RaiA
MYDGQHELSSTAVGKTLARKALTSAARSATASYGVDRWWATAADFVARTVRPVEHRGPAPGNSTDPKLRSKSIGGIDGKRISVEAADASFDLLVRKCMGKFRPHFERLSYHVNVENDTDGQIHTEATVKIRVGDVIRHEVAEGDGPVNALDAAMRKALNGSFPNLAKLRLVDYKVRVINSEAATAAGVRVIIESQDENDVWGTVGVSENIIKPVGKPGRQLRRYKRKMKRPPPRRRERATGICPGRGPGKLLNTNARQDDARSATLTRSAHAVRPPGGPGPLVPVLGAARLFPQYFNPARSPTSSTSRCRTSPGPCTWATR